MIALYFRALRVAMCPTEISSIKHFSVEGIHNSALSQISSDTCAPRLRAIRLFPQTASGFRGTETSSENETEIARRLYAWKFDHMPSGSGADSV